MKRNKEKENLFLEKITSLKLGKKENRNQEKMSKMIRKLSNLKNQKLKVKKIEK